jgi:hypothetical protein
VYPGYRAWSCTAVPLRVVARRSESQLLGLDGAVMTMV